MRARSWALRDEFTDVLKGLQIREEQADIILAPTAEGAYAMPEVLTDDSRLAAFEEMVEAVENGERIDEYITHLAAHFETTAEKIKAEAILSEESWQEFVGTYKVWLEKQPVPTEPRQFLCPHCDFKGASERGVKKHITQQHPSKPESPPEPETPDETPGEEESQATEPKTESGDQNRDELDPDTPVECYKCQRTVAYRDAMMHKGKDEIERYWCGYDDCN